MKDDVMLRLCPVLQHYDWGSATAIQDLMAQGSGNRRPAGKEGEPIAEAWYGAHPLAPSLVQADDGARALTDVIAANPEGTLGKDLVARFGLRLPYLLKILAAKRPLSLQVHPSIAQARAGFELENKAGIPLDSPSRNFRDTNHKPELVYALSPVEALCGFRTPRRAWELFRDLDAPLARAMGEILAAHPDATGVRRAFETLLTGEEASPDAVAQVAQASARRLARGSTSPRADRIVAALADQYPGDPGVVASLLLNPVSLRPGEVLFIPAGGVHSYQSGLMVEIMASSDNVLRAGLTNKHIDVPALLECVDYVAAPPMRIAPEQFGPSTSVFYAPVDDFELSVTVISPQLREALPGRGPRIVLALKGQVQVESATCTVPLYPGEAVFVPADEGPVALTGSGTVVQADAP